MTKTELKILAYTKAKVRALFRAHPAPAHNFDHAERVFAHARKIAQAEETDVFLCGLAALLHDVGRTREHAVKVRQPNTHHELSYQMCRVWFRTDLVLKQLTKQQKIILLYTIRYHWNNAADKYFEAVVLRDADKLDALGKHGIKRTQEVFRRDHKRLLRDFRYKYDLFYWLVTGAAQQIARRGRLMAPVDTLYFKLLRRAIKPIRL